MTGQTDTVDYADRQGIRMAVEDATKIWTALDQGLGTGVGGSADQGLLTGELAVLRGT